MPGIGFGKGSKKKILPRVTLGSGTRAAFRAMYPQRFGTITHGTIVTLGPAARAHLRSKGVTVDRFPPKFRVVDRR